MTPQAFFLISVSLASFLAEGATSDITPSPSTATAPPLFRRSGDVGVSHCLMQASRKLDIIGSVMLESLSSLHRHPAVVPLMPLPCRRFSDACSGCVMSGDGRGHAFFPCVHQARMAHAWLMRDSTRSLLPHAAQPISVRRERLLANKSSLACPPPFVQGKYAKLYANLHLWVRGVTHLVDGGPKGRQRARLELKGFAFLERLQDWVHLDRAGRPIPHLYNLGGCAGRVAEHLSWVVLGLAAGLGVHLGYAYNLSKLGITWVGLYNLGRCAAQLDGCAACWDQQDGGHGGGT